MFQIQRLNSETGAWEDIPGLLYPSEYLAVRSIQLLTEAARPGGGLLGGGPFLVAQGSTQFRLDRRS